MLLMAPRFPLYQRIKYTPHNTIEVRLPKKIFTLDMSYPPFHEFQNSWPSAWTADPDPTPASNATVTATAFRADLVPVI